MVKPHTKLRSKGGRKTPHRHKSTILWAKKFLPLLKLHHGNHAQRVFYKLMKKSSVLRSSLKKRSKEHKVCFSITLKEIRNMLYTCYGQSCHYCDNKLNFKNIACDHIIPISIGGVSTKENLQMICKRCNTRKGPLTGKQYDKLVKFLNRQVVRVRDYVFRKLSSKDTF